MLKVCIEAATTAIYVHLGAQVMDYQKRLHLFVSEYVTTGGGGEKCSGVMITRCSSTTNALALCRQTVPSVSFPRLVKDPQYVQATRGQANARWRTDVLEYFMFLFRVQLEYFFFITET